MAGVRPSTPSAWITAVSVSGSVPRIVAGADGAVVEGDGDRAAVGGELDDVVVGQDLDRPQVSTIPDPDPPPSAPPGPAPRTSILATDGRTVSATCCTEPSGAGVVGLSTACACVDVARPARGRGGVVVECRPRGRATEACSAAHEQRRGHHCRPRTGAVRGGAGARGRRGGGRSGVGGGGRSGVVGCRIGGQRVVRRGVGVAGGVAGRVAAGSKGESFMPHRDERAL